MTAQLVFQSIESMKKSLLIIVTILLLNASPKVFSATQQACQNIVGHWNGVGLLSSWLLGECRYHGSWTSKSVNPPGSFILYVVVTKDSGSFFCPKQGKTKFPGVCSKGNITIMTKHGNLYGDFSKKGGFAKGKVSILPGVGGDLRVDFFKVLEKPHV